MTEEEVSLLLFQTMEDIIENLDERENWEDFLRGFVDGTNPSYSHDGCEHSTTHTDPHRSLLPTFTARRMEEEDTPREETLSDYLQENESQ